MKKILRPSSKIYIAGHNGMVGSTVLTELKNQGLSNIVTRSHNELDLTRQKDVEEFFLAENIEFVILAAAKVGGILANSQQPVDFLYKNLMIEANIINAAFINKVTQLIFLGSSCIYPKFASQPICENELLSGSLEPTNEPYAIAKIAGIKLCQAYNTQYKTDYRSLMPTNLYGPNDNFDLNSSHVIPALIRKFHEAKVANAPSVEIWGTGNAKREFLFVEDMAKAIVHCMEIDNDEFWKAIGDTPHINIGTGEDLSIAKLASAIKSTTGYNGEIVFNSDYPDGTPRKLLDVNKANGLGWSAETSLTNGLKQTYRWYEKNLLN
jgi:GDP-L-fucose synthase